MAPLAALVSKADAETAIDALRNAGVYDDERSIAEYDAEHLAIPVNAEPTDVSIEGLVEQDDPAFRRVGLEPLLRERGFSEAEIERAPGSWAVIGDVILVAFGDCERREAVGNALLDLHGEADTVLARHGIAGETREPDVEVVAGAGQTETIHYEHGTAYALDLSRVMFAPGNKAERARMGEVVESGETVLDMFAGVGYFALPMARAGARVTAIEKNPEAFRLLAENAELNDVRDRVELLLGDCRDVVETRVEAADPRFDRIVMGYYDAYEYLDSALDALAPDGVLHMHEATPEAELWERPERRLRRAAEAVDRAVELVGRRRVKSHSEGVWHVVLDARVAGAD
ncbi:MAG: class I SAM-dependent methyltransferase family protein [Halanaeroarchaeum sp.]